MEGASGQLDWADHPLHRFMRNPEQEAHDSTQNNVDGMGEISMGTINMGSIDDVNTSESKPSPSPWSSLKQELNKKKLIKRKPIKPIAGPYTPNTEVRSLNT